MKLYNMLVVMGLVFIGMGLFFGMFGILIYTHLDSGDLSLLIFSGIVLMIGIVFMIMQAFHPDNPDKDSTGMI